MEKDRTAYVKTLDPSPLIQGDRLKCLLIELNKGKNIIAFRYLAIVGKCLHERNTVINDLIKR